MIDRLLLKCCVEDSTCYFENCFRLVVRDVYSVYSEAVSGQVSTRDMYTRIADPVSFIHDVRNSVGFATYLHTTSCSWHGCILVSIICPQSNLPDKILTMRGTNLVISGQLLYC